MSEEKSSSIGTMIVVAIAAGLIGYVIGKPAPPQVQAEKPDPPEKPEEPAFVKEGLVAYYPFNGNAKDESGNGHDGEVKGSALTQDRHSNADSAYEFTREGGSHISIPESDTLRPQKMTLNAWVYLSKEGADEPFIILFKEESFQLVIDNSGKSRATRTKNFFGLNTGGFGLWENLEYMGRVPAGEWFMYTATYDGATMSQHLNSQEICSGRFTGAVPYENSHKYPFLIGSTRLSRGNLANKLDDIRIYDRALSKEEIKALYDLEKPKGK